MASTSDTNEWTPQNTMRRVQSISMFSTESPRRVAGWDMGGLGEGVARLNMASLFFSIMIHSEMGVFVCASARLRGARKRPPARGQIGREKTISAWMR